MHIHSKHQSHIINTIQTKQQGIYKIEALAGTGKTTTAKSLIAQYPPDVNWLVLVFNKTNKEEWRKWKKNELPKHNGTIHSFAAFVMECFPKNQWEWIKKPSKNDYKTLLLNETDTVIQCVKKIVDEFEISLALELNTAFVQSIYKGVNHNTLEHYTQLSNKLWKARCDPLQEKFSLSESGGMKLVLLHKKDIKYDLVIWDEAQDIPDVHFGVMKKFQECATHVLFGDDYQTINLWRPGMNGAFNKLQSTAQLPQTYRFGKSLATLVNSLMRVMSDENLKKNNIYMKGNPSQKTWVIEYNYLSSIPIHKHGSILCITRTNRQILMELCKSGKNIQKTHYIDCKFTTKNKAQSKQFLQSLRELINLKQYGHTSAYPSIWSKYTHWQYVKEDLEMELLSENQADIASLVATNMGNLRTYMTIQEVIQNNDKKKPKFELSTTHGKKGSESEVVIVTDDFLQERVSSNMFEEYCIFNTAITRAKRILYYPEQYRELGVYKDNVAVIERAWIRYREWKRACMNVLEKKLPIELCHYVMRLV